MPPSPTTGAAITSKKAGTTDTRPDGSRTGVRKKNERIPNVGNLICTLYYLRWKDVLSALSFGNLRNRMRTLSRNQAIAVVTLLTAIVVVSAAWLTFRNSSSYYALTPERRRQESARVLNEARSSELAAHGTKPPSATQALG